MSRSPGDACSSSGAVTGTGERLGSHHIGVPRVGREDLLPEALAPDPRPVDTGALHCCSSPRPATASVGADGGRPGPFEDRLFGEQYEFPPA